MSNSVLLEIVDRGDFIRGFTVILKIPDPNSSLLLEFSHTIRSEPLAQLYRQLRESELRFNQVRSLELCLDQEDDLEGIRITAQSVAGNYSRDDFEYTKREYRDNLNIFCQKFREWLNEELSDFTENIHSVNLRRSVRQPIHIIIQTRNLEIQKLPWESWEVIERNSSSLGLVSQSLPQSSGRKIELKQPRILVIRGDSTKINTQRDLQILQSMSDAQIFAVARPTLEAFCNLITKESWDILFFAGHSFGNEFQINSADRVNLTVLRQSFRSAIDKGLKLAIFNSCDGLPLARQLTELGLQYVIAHRYPLPDKAAHRFLQELLRSLSQGEPLRLAIKSASRELEKLEAKYPGASLLPTLYQRLDAPELLWKQSSKSKYAYGVLVGVLLGVVGFGGYVWHLGETWGSSLQPDYSSLGETSLIDGETLAKLAGNNSACLNQYQMKLDGTEYFRAEPGKAAEQFRAFLAACPTDPEAKIYLHNAEILSNRGISMNDHPLQRGLKSFFGRQRVWRVAAVVPIRSIDGKASGEKLGVAQEILRGIEKTQEIIKDSNVNNEGKSIRNIPLVQIVDHDWKGMETFSASMEKIGKDLLHDPGVLGIVGPYTSDATWKLGEVLIKDQSGLIAVSPTSTGIRPSEHPNIFRTAVADSIAAERLLTDMLNSDRSIQEVTVIYDARDPSYSERFAKVFQEINKRDKRLRKINECEIRSMRSVDKCPGSPDAWLWIPAPDYIDPAVISIRGKTRGLPIWAGDSAYGRDILEKLTADEAANMKVFVSWALEKSTSGTFDKNSGVNWRTAMSLDAFMALDQAFKNMGTNPQRANVKDQLLSQSFSARGTDSSVKFVRESRSEDLLKIGDRQPGEEPGVIVHVQCTGDDCRYIPTP
ncbi:MAG: CHAT domain-containing protein [Elainella sp. Prado103]|jgi:branched-chain amino acid transport system substrate-binding protein|nr:CHAT domain-containing protein [Elainella sp. Prado103]